MTPFYAQKNGLCIDLPGHGMSSIEKDTMSRI